MTIYIHPNLRELEVMNDLYIITGDNALSMFPDGLVIYNQRASSVGANMVGALSANPNIVIIRGEQSSFHSHPAFSMQDAGGEALYDVYPGTRYAHIVYDVEDCQGRGSWVQGSSGPIPSPTYVTLFHEMSHVIHLLRSDLKTNDPEGQAIADENDFRTEIGLNLRSAHVGGCGSGSGSGDWDEGISQGYGCFIATAAYGSMNDANVQFLRHFRDEIIRKTRSGYDFFERFYKVYYAFSPRIVEQMKSDPEAKDLIRVSLVEPIIKFLRFFVEMPSGSIKSIQSPWREYLELIDSEFNTWVKQLELPKDFSRLNGIEAVSELAIILRYAFRGEDEQSEYMTELIKTNQIPIRLSKCELQTAQNILRNAGLQEHIINSLIMEIPKIMNYRNGPHIDPISSTAESAYSVTVTNMTSDTFSEITIFYNQHSGAITMERILNVIPNSMVVFNLGPCLEMKSYAMGFFIENVMVMKWPPGEENMTPEMASVYNPEDTERCADSWTISPETN